MVVELYKKAKSLTYELAWEIAWRKKKWKLKGRLKRSCETAKGKIATQSEKKKKKEKKNQLTRDLISFNLYLIFYLPRLQRSHDISHCLCFSPLFHSFVSFFFSYVRSLTRATLPPARITRSLALSLSRRSLSFQSLSHSLSTSTSLFLSFYIYIF